jgi:hypothetical protein
MTVASAANTLRAGAVLLIVPPMYVAGPTGSGKHNRADAGSVNGNSRPIWAFDLRFLQNSRVGLGATPHRGILGEFIVDT